MTTPRDAAVAALDAAIADAASTAAATASAQQHAADQQTIDALNQTIAQDGQQHTTDVATIADLQAQLAAFGPPMPAGYAKTLFFDDFTGTGVDGSKWNVRDGWQGGNEASTCLAANVSVKDSLLTIQPKREAVKGRQFTSGYLDTGGKFAAGRPCLFEARMRLPMKTGVSAGMWPAFWLRDRTGLGEIDIMEAWALGDQAQGSARQYDPAGKYQASSWPNTNSASNGSHGWAVTGVDLTAWHTYGVALAADGSATFLFDGKPTARADSAVKFPFLTSAFPSGYEIRLNLQVGQPGYYGLPNTQTDFTQSLQVDWVRCVAP